MSARLVTLAAVMSLGAACSGDPADVAGTYTMALTNRDNGCAIGNWTPGPIANPVTVVVTQSDDSASAEVQGLAGTALDVLLAGHVFTGSVDSDGVDLDITGSRAMSQGACAYTIDAELHGAQSGDTMAGQILYRARTNAAADCGTLTGCQSEQDFAGARPPT